MLRAFPMSLAVSVFSCLAEPLPLVPLVEVGDTLPDGRTLTAIVGGSLTTTTDGKYLFHGTAFDPNGGGSSFALFAADATQYEMVFDSKTPAVAPGVPDGAVMGGVVGTYARSTNGDAFFVTRMGGIPDTSTSLAIWRWSAGAFTLLARAGDPVPGFGPGVTFKGTNDFTINGVGADGSVVFYASLNGVPSSSAIAGLWWTPSGGLQMVAQTSADVTSPWLSWSSGSRELDIGADNQILVGGRFADLGDPTRWGMWAGFPGNWTRLYGAGDAVVGAGDGVTVDPSTSSMLSARGPTGETLLSVDLTGPGITPPANHQAIVRVTPGGPHTTVLQRGDPAPGLPGAFFGGFVEPLLVTRNGRVFFRGEASPTMCSSMDCVWAQDADGEPILVAHSHKHADPSRPANHVLGQVPGNIVGLIQQFGTLDGAWLGVWPLWQWQCPDGVIQDRFEALWGFHESTGLQPIYIRGNPVPIVSVDDGIFLSAVLARQSSLGGHLGVSDQAVTLMTVRWRREEDTPPLFREGLYFVDTGGLVSAPCEADLSGSADPNDPAYGLPDEQVDSSDFFYYLDRFVAGDLNVCDLTGSSDRNEPSYGVPDGDVDADDFFVFLDYFVAGCP